MKKAIDSKLVRRVSREILRTSKVVPHQRDTDVDQIIKPIGYYRLCSGTDNRNKLALEELVTVEEDVIGIPTPRGGE